MPTIGAQKPPVDIVEDTEEFVIFVDLPGVEPEEIKIKGYDNYLEITGFRKPVCGKSFLLMERFSGKFKRKIVFKTAVDMSRAQAYLKNGVLTIKVPKSTGKVMFTTTTIIIRR